MICRIYTIIYIVSLSLLLPQAMHGQTYLPKYQSKGWWNLLYKGGMIRTKEEDKRIGPYYMTIEEGVGGWMRMNYVDGFNFGPAVTLGRIDDDYNRWEVDLDTKYTVERNEVMGRFALRFISSPECDSRVELFAQRMTDDFDPEPMMAVSHRCTAASLFGWNSSKWYLKSTFGTKVSTPLFDCLQIGGSMWWERREQMSNDRRRNVFRVTGESNYPRLRGYDMSMEEDYRLLNWKEDRLIRLDMQLVFSPGSMILVEDDLHYTSVSDLPIVTLRANTAYNGDWDGCADYGTLQEDAAPNTAVSWNSGFRYLELELGIRQTYDRDRYRWCYKGSAGCFLNRNNIGVADMHHFDASHYLWQTEELLTWFSLLTNYEMSTSRHWAELHGEYLYRHNDFFGQYAQLHYLSVANLRPHYELSYGWQLPQSLRLGLSLGWDGSEYDGIGFNLVLPLGQ